jgi:hypothetical protein
MSVESVVEGFCVVAAALCEVAAAGDCVCCAIAATGIAGIIAMSTTRDHFIG